MVISTSWSTGFITVPRHICGFPASRRSFSHSCKIGDPHDYSGDQQNLQG
jgi:hypothetical protein